MHSKSTFLNKIVKILLVVNVFCYPFLLQAQNNNPLINSGEVLKTGIELYEKKEYKKAITEFLKVNKSDTNYNKIVYELSVAYSADSQHKPALDYALYGLKNYPSMFSTFSMQAANVYDDMGKSDEAIKVYNTAIEKNAQAYLLHFNKGISLIRLDKNEEAKACFIQTVLINPYYSSAHYHLGNIYFDEGNIVAAVLAYSTYLFINPEGRFQKNCIATLSDIAKVNDDVLEAIKNKTKPQQDNFDAIQQIVLSKIALDKQYELKLKLEDNIVRQLQVINEKLSYKANDNGFAMQYYVPLYTKLFKEDYFEPFVYHIFSGINLESINNWNKKNNKKNEALVNTTIAYLNEIRSSRILPYNERANAKTLFYYENGKYLGKGPFNKSNNDIVMIGNWEFYYNDNGALKAKGAYNNEGKKNGEWTYYYDNGIVKETAMFKDGKINGLVSGWFDNGNDWYKDDYKNDESNGLSTAYYYNGNKRKETNYKQNNKEGLEKEYMLDGNLYSTVNYINNVEDGKLKFYFANGKLQSEWQAKNGNAEGPYTSYYETGAVQTKGEYINNKREGNWQTFYENGKIKENTTYKNSDITGEFTEYHENGKLHRKGQYVKRKIDGKFEVYNEDGILIEQSEYNKGKLREINFYDIKGNLISNTSTKKGAAEIIFYSPEGVKESQGYYSKNGEKEREFITYFANGKIKGKHYYKDDLLDGEYVEYYANGKKNYETTYKNDVEDGYFKSYFYNGNLSKEGWIVEGSKQQQIIYYSLLGDLQTKEYYKNNDLDGYSQTYYPNQKIDCEYKYDEGWLQQIVQFDTLGNELASTSLKKGEGPVIYKHFNGNIYGSGHYKNYKLNGVYNNFYFDNKKQSVTYYLNGDRDSISISYFYNGKIQSEGKYKKGKKEGLWKYYFDNGKLKEEEMYKDGEIDGVSKVFNTSGTLFKVINYKNGKNDGDFEVYDEDGELAVLLKYKEGIIKGYTYLDKNGSKLSLINFKAGNGKVNALYKNGKPSASYTFINNDIEGEYKLWHTNGKPFVETSREYGYDNGSKKTYSSTGILLADENFILGNLHGIAKYFHANGKIAKELNFYIDDLHGPCKYYDEQGKLIQTRTYFYGNILSVK